MERANQTTLQHDLSTLYETLDERLIATKYAYNTSFHPVLGCTPFEAAYCFKTSSQLTLDTHTYLTPSPSSTFNGQVMCSSIDSAHNHLIHTQVSQVAALNQHSTPQHLAPDQMVWLSNQVQPLSP